MKSFSIRNAIKRDVPLLVDTIIEAEKSGTEILSYSTIFGLSEDDVRKYLTKILLEDIDGCELSISSFLVAEYNGLTVAAVSAWLEGLGGMSSSTIKGNLLNYILPKESKQRASKVNDIIKELHIEYIKNTIQIGAGFVDENYRGNRLLGILLEKIIEKNLKKHHDIKEVYAHIYDGNIASLKTFERLGFTIEMTIKASNKEIVKYLPSDKKHLLRKEVQLYK